MQRERDRTPVENRSHPLSVAHNALLGSTHSGDHNLAAMAFPANDPSDAPLGPIRLLPDHFCRHVALSSRALLSRI